MYQEQDLSDQRSVHIIIVRHGKPTKYAATDAELSPDGIEQITSLSHEFVTRLKATDRERLVQILYGSRKRTKQTASIMHSIINDSIKSGLLPNAHLADMRNNEVLQTADPLNMLQEKGIPPNELMSTWLTTPEEQLQTYGIPTPRQIANNLRGVIGRLICCPYWPQGITEKIDILSTHETSLAAIDRLLLKNPPKPIGYGACINIVARYPGDSPIDNPWIITP